MCLVWVDCREEDGGVLVDGLPNERKVENGKWPLLR